MKMVHDLKKFLAECDDIPGTPREETNDQDAPVPNPFVHVQEALPPKLPEPTEQSITPVDASANRLSACGLNDQTTVYQFKRMDFSKFNDETTIIPSTSAESKEVSGSGEQDQVMKGGAPRLSGPGPLVLATVQEEPNLNEVTNMSNMSGSCVTASTNSLNLALVLS